MADLTSYDGLKAAVEDYLGREDLTSQIPTFISLAETRLNRDLRLRVMERRATTSILAGQAHIGLPRRRRDGAWDVFLAIRDIVWTDSAGTVNLKYKNTDTYQVEAREQGRPRFFTVVGTELFLLPAPEQEGVLYLTYYAEIPPLSDIQRDNEVLLTAPDLYLYASLVEAIPYTQGSVPGELWQGYYREARNRVMQAEQSARYPANINMRPCRRV